jgi:hypothetical protein
MFSSKEIHHRVRSSYIERLSLRLKKMRKQLMDRDWQGLTAEIEHLQEGAQNFGYPDLALQVSKAMTVLKSKPLSKTTINTDAKLAMENLFQNIDRFLVEETHTDHLH